MKTGINHRIHFSNHGYTHTFTVKIKETESINYLPIFVLYTTLTHKSFFFFCEFLISLSLLQKRVL